MKTQTNPAFNACMTVLATILFVMAVGAATSGQASACFGLVVLTMGVALTVDTDALLPEWEQAYDIVESHPALVAPTERVHDHMLAWSPTHGNVELFHCTGTLATYEGLDVFGNLIIVEDNVVVDYISATELRNPHAA